MHMKTIKYKLWRYAVAACDCVFVCRRPWISKFQQLNQFSNKDSNLIFSPRQDRRHWSDFWFFFFCLLAHNLIWNRIMYDDFCHRNLVASTTENDHAKKQINKWICMLEWFVMQGFIHVLPSLRTIHKHWYYRYPTLCLLPKLCCWRCLTKCRI